MAHDCSVDRRTRLALARGGRALAASLYAMLYTVLLHSTLSSDAGDTLWTNDAVTGQCSFVAAFDFRILS